MKNDYVTQSQLEKALKKNNEELATKLTTDLTKSIVGEISEVMGTMMDRIDERFNSLEERVDKLEDSHQRLLSTVDGFVKRIEDYEVESHARDAQFARLTQWAKEVSVKTGIPMPAID